jgi:hypothetical protein
LFQRHKEAFGKLLGRFSVDFALLAPKRIADDHWALGRFYAAPTAPAKTMAGAKTMHLLTGMVDSAAVTKKRLGHGGLRVIWFSVSAEWLAKVAGR